MDAKGRFVMPSRYRDSLEQDCANQLVITIDLQSDCLLVYPRTEWDIIAEKITRMEGMSPAKSRLSRMVLGHAVAIEIDSNGRLLLPPELREYASLRKKLSLIGQGNKFELWDEDVWKQEMVKMKQEKLTEESAQEFTDFSL